jgi:hypothetical protein
VVPDDPVPAAASGQGHGAGAAEAGGAPAAPGRVPRLTVSEPPETGRPAPAGIGGGTAVTERLIPVITALAVAAVAAVAAVISYRHAYELVRTHGETGLTAELLPFTVDGLIVAASMLILDANRRGRPVPALARWCLGAGITATICANVAHGLGHGPVGALVSAWPALALACSFELLMLLIRSGHQAAAGPGPETPAARRPAAGDGAPTLEQTVRAWHQAGTSQRAIARELSVGRRKVKQIIDQAA